MMKNNRETDAKTTISSQFEIEYKIIAYLKHRGLNGDHIYNEKNVYNVAKITTLS